MKLRLPLLALAAGLALAGNAAFSQGRQAHPAVRHAGTAPAWPQRASDIPADPDVRFGTLPNGMRYALRHNATPPGQVSLRLRIGAGSLAETEDQRGLAHFIEHMSFNGSTHVAEGEFVQRLERHGLRFGPDTNAGTEFSQTVYKLDLPQSDAASLDEGLFLLREVAGEVSFAPAAIDRERGIVQSEERTRATPQYHIVTDQFGYLLRGLRLPTRWPIGLPAVIAGAQRERFLAFYNAYYRPERATLIAVGDFDVDAMEARIRARFSDWHGRGPAGPDPDLGTVAPRQAEARLLVEPGGPNQVLMNWVRAPDLRPDTSAHRAERLADSLVFQILNRRLERIAATQSPAPFVAGISGRGQIADSADFVQVVAVTQAGQWRRGLATIETEQRRLVEHGVTAAELAREIAELRTALTAAAAGAATRQSVALSDGLVAAVDRDDVFNAPAENLRLFEAAVAHLTPEQIGQSARTLFAGEPILYMTSPSAVDGGEATLLAAYRESRAVPLAADQVRQATAWPYTSFGAPGAIAERHELAGAVGATIVRFANGVRLTIKHTEFANDQILVAVRAGGGRLDLPADRASPEWALAGAFTAGGLGRITAEDMQEALASHAFGASLVVGDDAFQLIGGTRPGDFALQMQVLAAYVTDPGWRPTGWDRARSFSGTIHDQAASTPAGVFNRDATAMLRSGDRRWALPSREEMAASSIADARAALAGPLANGPIEVIIVGDVDVEEAIRQTAATFGALPPRADTRPPVQGLRFPPGNADPVRLTHGGRADQGLAYIAWPTTDFFADTRQARTLTLLADVYQLRLIQEIRERQATTYSPQSQHAPSETFAGYGLLSAQIEARPEALAGFLRDAERIAADLRETPIGADEMARALRPRIDTIQRQRNGNGWWLGNLARIQQDPRVAAAIASQIADYQAITPADLQRAARAFLRPERAWKAIVVPREAAPAS